jgi:hypothetical protein
LLPGCFTKWNERSKPLIAQVKSTPDEQAYINRKERMAEPRIADANVAGNRAAQISSEQDCPKYRRAGNQIESDAAQQKDANVGGELHGLSQFAESLYGRCGQWPDEFEACIHQQEQHDKAADDPSGP